MGDDLRPMLGLLSTSFANIGLAAYCKLFYYIKDDQRPIFSPNEDNIYLTQIGDNWCQRKLKKKIYKDSVMLYNFAGYFMSHARNHNRTL